MAPKKKGATASKKKIQIPADLREKLEVTFGEFSTDGMRRVAAASTEI